MFFIYIPTHIDIILKNQSIKELKPDKLLNQIYFNHFTFKLAVQRIFNLFFKRFIHQLILTNKLNIFLEKI